MNLEEGNCELWYSIVTKLILCFFAHIGPQGIVYDPNKGF